MYWSQQLNHFLIFFKRFLNITVIKTFDCLQNMEMSLHVFCPEAELRRFILEYGLVSYLNDATSWETIRSL